MKKYYLWTLALISIMVMGSVTQIHAKEVTNYLESFDGLDTKKHDFAPNGWGHIVDYLPGYYEDVYVTYTAVKEGGQKGAYIKAGTQALYNDDYDSKDAKDLLVTPVVRGTIKFYIKNSSYSTGKLNLYKCTLNNDKYTKGEEMTSLNLPTPTSEWQEVTLTLTENTYIGFRLHNVSLDEFSASFADIPDKKAIEIISATTTLSDKLIMSDQGKATLTATITFKNTGNVTLNPGDAGYSFNFVDSSNKALGQEETPSYTPDFSLEPNATSQPIVITEEYTYDPNTTRVPIRIRENLFNTYKQVTWLDVIPYIANLTINKSNLDFEVFKGSRSFEITLKNIGAAPLNISSVDIPEGYSLTVIKQFPYTINALESVNETVTLSGEAGIKEGNIVFNFEGKGDNTVAVKGAVVGADSWWEDFEKGVPQNWILPTETNWDLEDMPKTTQINKKCIGNGNQDFTSLLTPKITIAENDSIVFFAARKGTNSGMEVYYSTDRANWTLAKKITVSNEDKTCEFVTENKQFKPFTISGIPAGDYYLDFRAGYVYLDNIFGGKLAQTAHDFYSVSYEAAPKGMVNYPVSVNITIKNMTNKSEDAGTYSVILYEDGKEVKKVDGVKLEAYASHDFTLEYTPHTIGSHTLTTEIKTKDSAYSIQLSKSEIDITGEIAADEKVIGKADKNGSNVPLSLGYKNGISETIYKADLLGLKANSSIIKIAYPYYSTTEDITTHVTIWMENTTDESPEIGKNPADTLAMIKVFDNDYLFVKGGSSKEFLLTEFSLSNEFIYTGNNLRIVIKSTASTYKSYNFGYDSSITETTTYKRSDSFDSFIKGTMSSFSSGMPVIHIFTSKPVPVITGTITEKTSGAILADTKVTLTSGDVIYNGNTDASGAYSINVFQGNKDYELTVNEEDFADYKETLPVKEANITKDIQLDFTAMENAKVIGTNTNLDGIANESLLALVGKWTVEDMARLNTALGESMNITGIYMTKVPAEASATAFDKINPNALLYVKEDAVVPAEWKNVVKGDHAALIALTGNTAFAPAKTFTAAKISYTRPAQPPTWIIYETLCLPFAVNEVPSGCTLESFNGCEKDIVTFMETNAMEANTPYLIRRAEDMEFVVEATDVTIDNPMPGAVTKEEVTFRGTYLPIDNTEGAYYAIADYEFRSSITEIPAFQAYLEGISGYDKLKISDPTGIDQVSQTEMIITSPRKGTIVITTPVAQMINIYTVDGRLIRNPELTEGVNTITGLAQGIYFVNNRKIAVR